MSNDKCTHLRRATREKRKKEKEKRRKDQDANVRRKAKAKEEHRERSLKGMAKPKSKDELPEGFRAKPDSSSESDDDDSEWYRKEVGENPDKDLFDGGRKSFKGGGGGGKRKRSDGGLPARFRKKMKMAPPAKGDRNKDSRIKKSRRKTDVFNSQGIGPNYDKGRPNKGPRVTAKKGKFRRAKT